MISLIYAILLMAALVVVPFIFGFWCAHFYYAFEIPPLKKEMMMPDEIDDAQDREAINTENAIAKIRNLPPMPKGEPGECDLCGEWMTRLVRGACAPCRDRYKMP
jgi:hypothetical protein